jgi:beta-lactamase class A
MAASARDLVPISPRPELPFEERIGALETAFSGRLGYHAVHIDSGEQLALRPDEEFPTASVIKLGLVCALLDVVGRGDASLDELVTLPLRGERVPGGGVLKQLDVGRLSLRDLVELAICASDNVAANAIHERCGEDEAVNGYLAGLGLRSTRMLGPIDFARITHDLKGSIGVSTPREQTRLLTLLVRDDILTPELCGYLRGVLGRQHLLDQLPRWLGWNTYAQYHGRSWPLWVGSKSGELDGIRADVGVVRAEDAGTVVLAVFTDGGRDMRETVDVEGTLAVAECSAAICARLLGLDC